MIGFGACSWRVSLWHGGVRSGRCRRSGRGSRGLRYWEAGLVDGDGVEERRLRLLEDGIVAGTLAFALLAVSAGGMGLVALL